jgi:hypothetical protein
LTRFSHALPMGRSQTSFGLRAVTGKPPMDLGFTLEIPRKLAVLCLHQRLRLGLMPSSRHHESSIPSPLEFLG